MKKNNLKSVRISDKVLEYVQNFEGDGFNQKFENLVLFCMEQEQQKLDRLKDLDDQIRQRSAKLDTLRSLESQVLSINRDLAYISHTARKCADALDRELENL